MRSIKILVLSSVLLMGGCSTFGFFFERLDWIAVWQMDDMFDLTRKQEALLESAALNMRDWLRSDGFPDLIEKLEQIKSLWLEGRHEESLDYLESAGQAWFRIFLPQLWSEIKPLALTVGERNAKQYREYTEAKYEDWFEYAESDETKVDFRIEQLEEWFGRLTDDQAELVEKYVKLQPNEREIRIKNSMQWRENFLSHAMAKDEAALDAWIENPQIWWTAEFVELRTANFEADRAMAFELFTTLSEKQKRKAVERVDDWLDTLRSVLD